MKKAFLLMAFALILAGCGTLKQTQRVVLTSFSDYRQYTEEGFLISPMTYTYNYESIGDLEIVLVPAQELKETPSLYAGSTATHKTLVNESISYNELVEMAVNQAKSKGADAIVNFSIKKEDKLEPNRLYGGYIEVTTYYISGFCIKRK
jgi:uncharacterized protein YbjQ (UPF0145 family)